MLQPVIQEQTSGCGIASSAVLLGLSYAQMKATANAMGIFAEDPALWSDTQYVRRLLATGDLVVSATEEPFVSWEALPDMALLAIKHHWEGDRPFWHWVVFFREGDDVYVLDSKKALKQHCRRDFGRIKPKWFIPVSSA